MAHDYRRIRSARASTFGGIVTRRLCFESAEAARQHIRIIKDRLSSHSHEKLELLASLAGVQYGLAIHYDAATEQTLSAPREVAVATSLRHALERIIDQISGDLLTHVIAHFQ
jgi:hypothetical protein